MKPDAHSQIVTFELERTHLVLRLHHVFLRSVRIGLEGHQRVLEDGVRDLEDAFWFFVFCGFISVQPRGVVGLGNASGWGARVHGVQRQVGPGVRPAVPHH